MPGGHLLQSLKYSKPWHTWSPFPCAMC